MSVTLVGMERCATNVQMVGVPLPACATKQNVWQVVTKVAATTLVNVIAIKVIAVRHVHPHTVLVESMRVHSAM